MCSFPGGMWINGEDINICLEGGKKKIMTYPKDDGREDWNKVLDCIKADNLLQLGTYYTNMVRSDVKHLAFTLSRYKFASKLLMYKEDVELLELGCQEAFGALMFQQNISLKTYTGIDFDKRAIEWDRENLPSNMEFICADFFDCPELGDRKFDAVVSLDVIEHIAQEMEGRYCEVVGSRLKMGGGIYCRHTKHHAEPICL